MTTSISASTDKDPAGGAEPTAEPATPIVRAARVQRSVADAFRIFTDEIGAWWPLPSHGLYGDRAGGVAFRDGRLIEYATDGTETVWGEVLAWEPPDRLVVTWHPGRDASDGSEVEVRFEADGAGTRVVVEHRGWEAFGADGLARRRGYVGPGAWGHVLDHFADGAEPRTDGADLSMLTSAYEAFFAEADAGGFGPPNDDGWTAEEVVAHVTLNDAALSAVGQALVHGDEPLFANTVCQDRRVLAAWIEAHGDLDGLVERGRHAARVACATLARLSPEQRATEVACRLEHDGQVVLDGPMPWGQVADTIQATRHLPAHIEQLGNLRT